MQSVSAPRLLSLLLCCLPISAATSVNRNVDQPLARIAELDIEPAQLDAYTAALKEEISTSIRVEPGVLTLNAVALKDHPNQIRIFEVYANQAAYESHLASPHFKQYKTKTAGMVKSLKLLETNPIQLASKGANP